MYLSQIGSQTRLSKGEQSFPFVGKAGGNLNSIAMAFNSDRRLVKDFAKFNKLQQVDDAKVRIGLNPGAIGEAFQDNNSPF